MSQHVPVLTGTLKFVSDLSLIGHFPEGVALCENTCHRISSDLTIQHSAFSSHVQTRVCIVYLSVGLKTWTGFDVPTTDTLACVLLCRFSDVSRASMDPARFSSSCRLLDFFFLVTTLVMRGLLRQHSQGNR